MEILRINFLPVLARLAAAIFFAQSISGIVISIGIFAISFFIAFKLNLCSNLPDGIPFKWLICNRLFQALVIFVILKKIFVRR